MTHGIKLGKPISPVDANGHPAAWDEVGLATEASLSQLAMTITNAIDSTAYDLNAAAFSVTSSITKDAEKLHLIAKFSTAEIKTISVFYVTGGIETLAWGGDEDISGSNQGYNTIKKNFVVSLPEIMDSTDEIKVTVTQTSGACTIDKLQVKARSGTNTLLGDPTLNPNSKTQLVDANGNVIGSSANGLLTCPEEHHTAYNEEFIADSGGDIAPIAIITPASGKKVSIHVIAMVHTDGNAGVINIDFLTSAVKALRMYPSRLGIAAASQDHTEGAIDEALTFEASGIGNGSRVFVKLQYIEE
jgi:hypothetical protein